MIELENRHQNLNKMVPLCSEDIQVALLRLCFYLLFYLQTRFQKSCDTVQIVNKKECNNLQIS